MRDRIREGEENAKFWHDQAKGATRPAPVEATPEPEPEMTDAEVEAILGKTFSGDESAQQVVDDLSEKGIAALKKRGVVTSDQALALVRRAMAVTEARANRRIDETVRREVGNARRDLDRDADMYQQFPDLRDQKSELFQRTARIYQAEVAEDPKLKTSHRALLLAAKQAEQEMEIEDLRKGRSGRRGAEEESGPEMFELTDQPAPTSRERRIAAQSGDRGGGARRQPMQESPDTLSREQRNIISRFNADGQDTISEADYVKYGKNLHISGLPGRSLGGR
jgi:hypothetical protein